MGFCIVLRCEDVQAALSARLDGEADPAGLDPNLVDAHLSSCEHCQEFYEQAARMNRSLSFEPAPSEMPPDLSQVILEGVEPQWRRQARLRTLNTSLSRVVMVILAVVWVLWGVHMLGQLSVDAVDVDAVYQQLIVESAALRFAIGFSLVFAAWQPRITGGLLPLFGAFFMFSFGFGMRDLLLGTAPDGAITQLVLVAGSIVALGWAWVANQGWIFVQQALKALTANPN